GHHAYDGSDDRPQADQHEADHGQGATAALVILRADDTPDGQRYRDESETGTGGDQREQRDRVQRWFRRRGPRRRTGSARSAQAAMGVAPNPPPPPAARSAQAAEVFGP